MKDDLKTVEHAELINSLTRDLERQRVENIDIEAADHTARARVHPNALPLPAIHTFFVPPAVT